MTSEKINLNTSDLQPLLQNIRVVFASLICFARSWTRLAKTLGRKKALADLGPMAHFHFPERPTDQI